MRPVKVTHTKKTLFSYSAKREIDVKHNKLACRVKWAMDRWYWALTPPAFLAFTFFMGFISWSPHSHWDPFENPLVWFIHGLFAESVFAVGIGTVYVIGTGFVKLYEWAEKNC